MTDKKVVKVTEEIKPQKIFLMGDKTPIFTGSGCDVQTIEDFTGSSARYRLYNVRLVSPADVNRYWDTGLKSAR
jgi:hypothetical protein